MDHVGVVVEDLESAVEFFLELGLERGDGGAVQGEAVDRVVGLEGVRSNLVFLSTPDGHAQIELSQFETPRAQNQIGHPPPNAPGIRHLTFAVDEIRDLVARLNHRGYGLVGELVNYEDTYWLCYVRGPEGIIVELAEKIA